MRTSNVIQEIELNTSNICGASCIICSRAHGNGNIPFMPPEIFNELVKQLKDVDFKMIQTSGNGEALLNPHHLDYISTIRKNWPSIPMWTYNNFSFMTKDKAERIVNERLFDSVTVRIDSLHKWIFEKNSNLNQDIVFENLKYFLSINKDIPVVLLYNNITEYYAKCLRVTGHRPARDYFSDADLAKVTNEEQDIRNYFQPFSKVPLRMSHMGHSLWGERHHAPLNPTAPCPKWNVINNVTWVCPNGDIDVCCYDDTQSRFVAGNIMKEHILDIFYGPKRAEILANIKSRAYKDYPCTNPVCCSFGDGGMEPK